MTFEQGPAEARIVIPRTLSPAAFAHREAGGRVERFTGRTMGTDWSLAAVSPRAGVAGDVQGALDRVVAQMSQWEPGSHLSRFNRATLGAWQMLPPEFTRVLRAALDVAEASGGAFSPAMGALSDAWGFGAAPAPDRAPGPAEIEEILRGARQIALDGPGLRARRTGNERLDFSGIAKGFAVDLAAEHLLASGVRHFLIEVGGELRGHGLRPDGQPWWVDIEVPPRLPAAPMRAALHEMAVATSGNYRRWLDVGGRRYSHTLDPRTGRPVENGVASVTVLHPSCMLADAWATALTVLGPAQGMAVAEEQGLAAQMIAEGEEHISPALLAMLD